MKKFVIFLAILLLVSFTGMAQAQLFVDPVAGPEVWVTSVYNNSGSSLSAGDVVIWDIASSTGDNDNYVTTTTAVDTTLIAGVVFPNSIGTGEIGSIAVRGAGIKVNTIAGGSVAVGTSLCTGATAGSASVCSETGGDPNRIGFCTSANTGSSCTAFISVL